MKLPGIALALGLMTLICCAGVNRSGGGNLDQNPAIASHDASLEAPFGDLAYRVYYPAHATETTYVIHVSRGGNGRGDDRGHLLSYVETYVRDGYVVVQVDHRNARWSGERIARFRGEEIRFMARQVERGNLDYGDFKGRVDGTKQGFAGHSGGCMEGLMAAGTQMTHGNYRAPQIKAVYGISPAGYKPDQFGISQNPGGYSRIGATAVFVVVGEQELDINGPGRFMQDGWRLQAFAAMNVKKPRFQAVVMGDHTDHIDVAGRNRQVQRYNFANSLALFDTFVRGQDRRADIGKLSPPESNRIELKTK